jgi:hypothetical protein
VHQFRRCELINRTREVRNEGHVAANRSVERGHLRKRFRYEGLLSQYSRGSGVRRSARSRHIGRYLCVHPNAVRGREGAGMAAVCDGSGIGAGTRVTSTVVLRRRLNPWDVLGEKLGRCGCNAQGVDRGWLYD